MNTLRTVTTTAALFALTFASLAGCAYEPADGDTSADRSPRAENEDGVESVAQALGPQQPCELIPGGCEGGNGSGGDSESDLPPHTNKGLVAACAKQRTTCFHKCRGTNAQILACQTKCTKAHKECLEDY